MIKTVINFIKNVINTVLDISIILCKGYFCLLLGMSVIKMLCEGDVISTTLLALVILIVSNYLKDKVNRL